jgi:hypothetical protein
MDLITALAIVIGALAAVATWLCLGPAAGVLAVWALFIGWGSFFHTGGKEDGLKKSAICHIWGAVLAAITLVIIGSAGQGLIVNALLVGISVFVLVMGAKVPLLSTIPAAVYGYASTAAAVLLANPAILGNSSAVFKAAALTALSLIVGNIFGYVSEKIAGLLVKSA